MKITRVKTRRSFWLGFKLLGHTL